MRVMTKETNFRCPKLLALAKECPHCMSCGDHNQGDVVAAHSNNRAMGKGMGIKAHDLPAYLCRVCHDIVDGRSGDYTRDFRDYREFMWHRAMAKSMVWLLQEGHLKVTA